MKTYVGNAQDTAGPHAVAIEVDGEMVGMLRHYPKHSPTGVSWGYAGSGPADLARSMLIDHLGDKAWCPTCAGRGRAVYLETTDTYHPVPFVDEQELLAKNQQVTTCPTCWGEGTSFGVGMYQRFKSDVISRLPQAGEWRLTGDDIEAWVLAHRAGAV